MPKRLATLTTLVVGGLLLLAVLPSAYASAAQPWWQVVTGSRPTNLWEPVDALETQEVTGEKFFGLVLAVKVEVGGSVVGCLGSGSLAPFGGPSANEVCENETGFPASETASEFAEMLEGPYGAGKVQVIGGPAGAAPFKVESPWGPPIEVTPLKAELFGIQFSLGSNVGSKVLSEGSGRLVLTLTNLGDATIDGSGTPVTIVDKLPQGAIASSAEAFAGGFDTYGPVDCAVAAADEVACTYGGKLPPYQAIEIEIFTSLEGSPPVAGAPGHVTVSGGGAASVSTAQSIKVSDEPVRFGIERFSAAAEEEGGGPVKRAGSHPFQFTTTVQLNAGAVHPTVAGVSVGARYLATEQPGLPRNLRFPLPAGLVGNAAAMPTCKMETFLPHVGEVLNTCPDSTVVGVSSATIVESGTFGLISLAVPVFNLPPAFGEPARFGFVVTGVPVLIDTEVDPDDDYRITARVSNISQAAQFLSATTTLWGTPGDPRHDSARGWNCVWFQATEPCVRPASLDESAFMRMPVQCSSPLDFGLSLEPWNTPLGTQVDNASFTSDPLQGCNIVPFDPSVEAAATNKSTQSPSGLSFSLKMPSSGLLNGDGIAEGQPKKVEVDLPEGMTVNPSQGEGLVGCGSAEYARETATSQSGEGCPEASKIGTVQIATPLLNEEVHGSIYVASPHDNPFGSLLSLYMVAKIPDRGILIKQAGKVEPDPINGQLTTTFDDLPQLPFSSFELHFKEGPRAPLVTPEACGSYDITAKFTPWNAVDPSNPQPSEIVTRTSQFIVDQSPHGTACPSGTPPFHPGFTAGTENNAAGIYSPFKARLTREDGEQEFSRFSLKLPKGVIGNLSGIPFCSEAAIAQARSRTGVNGGQEELDSPSCPAASQIGRTLVGAGVGPSLTYVPGNLYLAGPYQGGEALGGGDHAGQGRALRPRQRRHPPGAEGRSGDRRSLDRRLELGSDPAHPAGDRRSRPGHPRHRRPEGLRPQPDQLRTDDASAAAGPSPAGQSPTSPRPLPGRRLRQPRLQTQAGAEPQRRDEARGAPAPEGGPDRPQGRRQHPRRGGRPAALGVPRTGPHPHRLHPGPVQRRRRQRRTVPKGSIYGRVKAVTPLLDEPLTVPVYLRSSNHPLPDLVAALIRARSTSTSTAGSTRSTAASATPSKRFRTRR